MVIAVDFDGTISLGNWPNVGPENKGVVSFIKDCKANGNKIILWTCREGEHLKEAVEWCKEIGIEFDAVNDNLIEHTLKYGCNSRKIHCDMYIDDKCINISELEKRYRNVTC